MPASGQYFPATRPDQVYQYFRRKCRGRYDVLQATHFIFFNGFGQKEKISNKLLLEPIFAKAYPENCCHIKFGCFQHGPLWPIERWSHNLQKAAFLLEHRHASKEITVPKRDEISPILHWPPGPYHYNPDDRPVEDNNAHRG